MAAPTTTSQAFATKITVSRGFSSGVLPTNHQTNSLFTSSAATHPNLRFETKTTHPKIRMAVQELKGGSPVLDNNSNPIIVIDNYDSFLYNLCQYIGVLGCYFEVYRNDELTVEELKRKNPRGVLISPGPGKPQDSGISLQTVLELGPTVPVFGVCMGGLRSSTIIGAPSAFCKIVRSPSGPIHGKSSLVYYDEKGEDGLLAGLSNPFKAGRYHGLVIEKESFPSDTLEVTAWTEDGLIMAARHKKYKHVQGVQFHPESILTPEGMTIVRNFLKLIEKKDEDFHK